MAGKTELPRPEPLQIPWQGRAARWLLPIMIVLAVTQRSTAMAVAFAAVFLLLSVGKAPWNTFRARLDPLALAVLVYCGLCMLSGLWCHFGEYALRETTKLLTALSVYGVALLWQEKPRLRALLLCLSAVLAAVGLLCIDASSLCILSRAYLALTNALFTPASLGQMGYEAGIRITGIYGNANVSAGLLAFGLLLTLYLLRSEDKPRLRLLLCVSLGIQALAFFLSFSMGAMAAFVLSCLVYLFCTGKEDRLPLLLLMLACIVVTVACAFAATPFLGTVSPLPIPLSLVCGLVLWLLDRFVIVRLSAAIAGRGRRVGVIFAAVLALLVIYLLLAMNLTGPVSLRPGNRLSRAIYPDAGTYSVSVEGTEAQVLIYCQDESQLMMHTNTQLYSGPLNGAEFTVPTGTKIVWFVLEGDGTLNRVSLSDGTRLPLGYRLLPSFAANRLQGLFANQNLIQRFAFFRDGLRLWKDSPLIGWGIGGVEGQLTSVQTFYYESKYIHNQFIQIMDEAGIPGLLSLLFLLCSAVGMLLRRRREDCPLFPVLAACITMILAHSLLEVVWSTQYYLTVIFLIFAVLQRSTPGEPEPAGNPPQVKPGRRSGCLLVGFWVVSLVFALLLGGNLLSKRISAGIDVSNISAEDFISAMQTADTLNAYDDAETVTNLMGTALQTGGTEYAALAKKCSQRLEGKKEFDSAYLAAAYYHAPIQNVTGVFRAMETGLMQERSNPDAWNSAFSLYRQVLRYFGEDRLAAFAAGVAGTGELLDKANQWLIAPVALNEENQAFLDAARRAAENPALAAEMAGLGG